MDLAGWGGLGSGALGGARGRAAGPGLVQPQFPGRWVGQSGRSVLACSCECAAPAPEPGGDARSPPRPRGFGPDASFPGARFGRVSASAGRGPGAWPASSPIPALPGRGCRLERSLPMCPSQPEWTPWSLLTFSKSGIYGPLPKSCHMQGLVITGSTNLLSALLLGGAPQPALCPVLCGSLRQNL